MNFLWCVCILNCCSFLIVFEKQFALRMIDKHKCGNKHISLHKQRLVDVVQTSISTNENQSAWSEN